MALNKTHTSVIKTICKHKNAMIYETIKAGKLCVFAATHFFLMREEVVGEVSNFHSRQSVKWRSIIRELSLRFVAPLDGFLCITETSGI